VEREYIVKWSWYVDTFNIPLFGSTLDGTFVATTTPTNGVFLDHSFGSDQFYQARLNRVSYSSPEQPFLRETKVDRIPLSGEEKVHLNLWLHDRTAPSDDTNKEFEVVVTGFKFTPFHEMVKTSPRVDIEIDNSFIKGSRKITVSVP
jgi:hypothetical protein